MSLLHPIAQLRHMHAQVLRSLHIGHASLLDQAHSLKPELADKLPSLHDPPPAPSKHLTRCLRNRVQAIWPGRSGASTMSNGQERNRLTQSFLELSDEAFYAVPVLQKALVEVINKHKDTY